MYLRFSVFSNSTREGNSLEDNGNADVALRFPCDRNFLSLIDSLRVDDNSSMGTYGAKDLDLNLLWYTYDGETDSKSDKNRSKLLGGDTIILGTLASFKEKELISFGMLGYELWNPVPGKLSVLLTRL